MPRRVRALVALSLVLGACASSQAHPGPAPLRLGYYATLTHATALVGIERGLFARELFGVARLAPKVFSAGPAETEALLSGSLDAAFIGPNPAVNAFVRSHGEAIRVIAGAASGGSFFVAQPGIFSAADLRGKKVAAPQLGNTQDVALRTWLESKGLHTTAQGGGDVTIVNQENATTLRAFRSRSIAGAWVPEPWASRLVLEGGGSILVDERTLWPGGHYATTVLVVRPAYLRAHRDAVEALLRGDLAANDYIATHPGEAKIAAIAAIASVTGQRLKQAVLDRAWPNIAFSSDPIASSVAASAEAARRLGFLPEASLQGLFDLSALNDVLRRAGKPGVTQP